MEADKQEDVGNTPDQRNISTLFNIRDVAVILVTAVSIASAFFMYSTRVTVLEKQVEGLEQIVVEIKNQDKTLIKTQNEIAKLLESVKTREDNLEEDVDLLRGRILHIERNGKGGGKK